MDTISKELSQTYSKIFQGGTAEKPAKSGSKQRDTAYEEPDYSGEGSDGVDPRDPSTFKEEDDKTEKPQPEPENEDLETEPEGEGEDDKTKEDDFEEIPERLVAAGRRRGYSDEKIVKLAEDSPEVLEDLADLMEMATIGQDFKPSAEPQTKPEEKAEEVKQVEKIHLDTDLIEAGDDVKSVIKKLESGYNSMVDRVNELQGKTKAHDESLESFTTRQQQDYVRQVDTYFDQASKDYPELGKSGQLSADQVEFRQKVHDDAVALAASGNRSMGEAFEFVLNSYKGQQGEKHTKERLRKDLETRKKQHTARPSHRKESSSNTSPESRAMEAIENFQREHGWI